MKAREKDDSSGWFGLPRWLALFFGVLAIVAVGFLLWLSFQALNRSSTLDARRVRSLDIAADYIAKWPEVATTIGQSSLFHRSTMDPPGDGDVFYTYLYHPEFGDFQIQFDRSTGECPTDVQINNNKLTVKGEALKAPGGLADPEKSYVNRARDASWIELPDAKQRVCFTIANLDLKRVAPPLGTFSHLLLIKEARKAEEPKPGERPSWREGAVVARVGSSELPIRSLSDLPALESEVSKVAAATAQVYGAAAKEAAETRFHKSDALEPFDSRVAGKDYRFYWRPIVLAPPGAPQGAGQPDSYYLVGVAPRHGAPDPGQSRTQMLAFAFAIFMLIALMPVVKLALLGPVDSMKAIEVAAICLGIGAAAALGTAFWIGTQDVLVARKLASDDVTVAATKLSGIIEGELLDTLRSPEMDAISQETSRAGTKDLVAGRASFTPETKPGTIAKIENLFLLDANGKQAAGTVMNAARDHVGANFSLNDRIYFRRAIDDDFAPGTQVLARERREKVTCDIWNDIEDGLVFDQVRSRTDGAPKTIIAAKLKHPVRSLQKCNSNPSPSLSDKDRLMPSVIGTAFVMQQMLLPKIDAGVRYAVLDVRDGVAGRPVLFHSDSYRVGVEKFDAGLDAHTLQKLSDGLGDPVECPSGGGNQPTQFSGVYEEETSLFTAVRVPCTDWAVVAFKSRQLIDAQAVKPAVHAIVVWASLMIIPYFLWMVAALRWGDSTWVWLWPEPTARKKKAYLFLGHALAGAAILGLLLVKFVSPLASFLLNLAAALAALIWLFWVHYETKILAAQSKFVAAMRNNEGHVRPHAGQECVQAPATSQDAQKPGKPVKEKLDDATERRFLYFAVALIVTLAVLPITALSADARGYFARTSAASHESLTHAANYDRDRLRNSIARMEGMPTEPVNRPLDAKPKERCFPHYYTQDLRAAANYEDSYICKANSPKYWILGFPFLGLMDNFTLASLAAVLVLIMVLAVWASVWGLFGFGVALEAVEYPELNVEEVRPEDAEEALPEAEKAEARDGKPEEKEIKRKEWRITNVLPPRFLVVRANEKHLSALKRNAVEIDLFEEIRTGKEVPLPEGYSMEPRIVLIHNLGMVFGDPEARRKALERIEKILLAQKSDRPHRRKDDKPNFLVAMLTSLTPLERLLQSFERERDENDQLDEEQKIAARLQRAKYREDMRWSAVFEEFTTYFHAAQQREKPAEYAKATDAVKFVWEELEYVSDVAVGAMIWDPFSPVLGEEILKWAEGITENCKQPRALVDFLASNLIEHYHLMWSLSSREERLLLYRIAHGHVPNVAKAYALRSLVKRGLVVLGPYPRTMNKSFAQFVQHVEKQDTIKNWRRTQEHGSWDIARLPIILALPIAVVLLVIASARSGDSFAAIIPLIVAAGPALINALSSARRNSAA